MSIIFALKRDLWDAVNFLFLFLNKESVHYSREDIKRT